MNPKPVPETRVPSYPTRREVLAGAAGLALASLGGRWQVLVAAEDGAPIVAPLFDHGEGRGASGCIVVSPPVFLSEEEAMQIIREELGKRGIQLNEAAPLKDVHIPQRTIEYGARVIGDGKVEFITKTTEDHRNTSPLRPSGIDPDKMIVVEYITEMRDDPFGASTDRGTVSRYDFKDAAAYVAEQVKKQSKQRIYLGLFYDPAVGLNDPEVRAKRTTAGGRMKFEEYRELLMTKSKALVRQQAQDFVAWLKENKAIQ